MDHLPCVACGPRTRTTALTSFFSLGAKRCTGDIICTEENTKKMCSHLIFGINEKWEEKCIKLPNDFYTNVFK
jgi:hypothetical protein